MNFKKKFFSVVLFAAMIVCLFPVSAFAEDEYNDTDSAGNVIIVENDCRIEDDVENELYAIGNSVDIESKNIGGMTLALGSNVNITNCEIDGSALVFAAKIKIDSKVKNNINAFADSIDIGLETDARAIRLFGNDVSVSGKSQNILAFANNIYIDGIVDGDVTVRCNKITFSDNAKITGKLSVTSPDMPEVPDSLGASDFKYTKSNVEESSDSQNKDENIGKTVIGGTGKVVKGLIFKTIFKAIFLIISNTILAFVFYLLFKKQMEEAVIMVKERTAPQIISGAVGFICIPIACIILLITVIGARLGIFTFILYVLIIAFSRLLVCITYIREFFFAKSQKPRNVYLELFLMAILSTFVNMIPLLGKFVSILCIVLPLGYFIQKGYLTLKGNTKKADN